MSCSCRTPPCNCNLATADCPFALNLERFHNNQGYDQWPGAAQLALMYALRAARCRPGASSSSTKARSGSGRRNRRTRAARAAYDGVAVEEEL